MEAEREADSSFDLALIFSLAGILAQRAGNGDSEAGRVLKLIEQNLQAAARTPWPPSSQSEWARGGPRDRQWNEWEELQVREGLLILREAIEGHSGYPAGTLNRIGEQVRHDCEEVGIKPPDASFLRGDKG